MPSLTRGGKKGRGTRRVIRRERKMRGGSDPLLAKMSGGNAMLPGSPVTGGMTSGQQYGVQAVVPQRGGEMEKPQIGQVGGGYQMLVPAALVLANDFVGRGKSMRYKGKKGSKSRR